MCTCILHKQFDCSYLHFYRGWQLCKIDLKIKNWIFSTQATTTITNRLKLFLHNSTQKWACQNAKTMLTGTCMKCTYLSHMSILSTETCIHKQIDLLWDCRYHCFYMGLQSKGCVLKWVYNIIILAMLHMGLSCCKYLVWTTVSSILHKIKSCKCTVTNTSSFAHMHFNLPELKCFSELHSRLDSVSVQRP